MTRQNSVNYIKSLVGKYIDFDGLYKNQCVDLFNDYVQWQTGVSPYSQGFGVDYAYQLIERNSRYYLNVTNNPQDPNQLPAPGDIAVFGNNFLGANIGGHVTIVLEATVNNLVVVEQNGDGRANKDRLGRATSIRTYTWGEIGDSLLGWFVYKNYNLDPVEIKTTRKEESVDDREITKGYYTSLLDREPSEPEYAIHAGSTPLQKFHSVISSEEYKSKQSSKLQLADKLSVAESELANCQSANGTLQTKIRDYETKLQEAIPEKSTPPAKSANKLVLRTASLSGLAVIVADVITNYLIIMAARFGVDIDPTAVSEIKTFVTGTFIAMALWIGQFAYKKGKKFIV